MTINNLGQLDKVLTRQMKKAMNVAAKKMEADACEEVGLFYTEGVPKVYVRTGALGDTPQVTAVTTDGKTARFSVYLDQTHVYSSGMPMSVVLDLAEEREGGVLGKPHFWKRSQKDFQKTLTQTMQSFF